MNRPRLAAALAIILTACGNPSDPADSGPPAEVELGTGTTEWEPLETNQELVLISGPQGGHHFIVHARIRNLFPGDPRAPGQQDNPSTRFRAYEEDSGAPIHLDLPPSRLGYGEPDNDGFNYLASGRLLIVDDEEGIEQWLGERVQIEVEVTDNSGASASDRRTVTVLEDLDPQPDAGVSDAGLPDAGLPDAGLPDAAEADGAAE